MFLPHQWQVSLCPAWGAEAYDRVCVWERDRAYRWVSEHTSWVADSEQIKTRMCSSVFEDDSSVGFQRRLSQRRAADWRGGGPVLFNCCSDMTHAGKTAMRASCAEHIFNVTHTAVVPWGRSDGMRAVQERAWKKPLRGHASSGLRPCCISRSWNWLLPFFFQITRDKCNAHNLMSSCPCPRHYLVIWRLWWKR